MQLGYLLAGVGIAIGFGRLADGGAEAIEPVALLAVGALGIVSFLRHSVFHRSDAARMQWESERRNNFQIEVGIANLAWGLVAIAAVVWDWGVPTLAALTGVFGLYLLMAAAVLFDSWRHPEEGRGRSLAPTLATGAFAVLLIFFALSALSDAGVDPF